MRQLYSFLLYLLTPFLVLRLWWKGRQNPGYRHGIADRFSLSTPPDKEFDVWVHAVSLGEAIAATPLIETMLAKQWRILVTTMTPTGANHVKAKFANRVEHRYVSYDVPLVVRRFYKTIKFRVGLIMETELWPNLIRYANKAGVSLYLINARLSERSCKGYKKIRFLIEPALNQFQGILTQCAEDAERFKDLGAPANRVSVLGNMKFDLQTKNLDLNLFQALKARWGADRTAFIIASTHDDEEQQILSRLRTIQASIPDLVLLIAPRHPERFKKLRNSHNSLAFALVCDSAQKPSCLKTRW